jgi:hypothetical protein
MNYIRSIAISLFLILNLTATQPNPIHILQLAVLVNTTQDIQNIADAQPHYKQEKYPEPNPLARTPQHQKQLSKKSMFKNRYR